MGRVCGSEAPGKDFPPFSSNYTFNVKITVYGICLLDGIPTEGFFFRSKLKLKISHQKKKRSFAALSVDNKISGEKNKHRITLIYGLCSLNTLISRNYRFYLYVTISTTSTKSQFESAIIL